MIKSERRSLCTTPSTKPFNVRTVRIENKWKEGTQGTKFCVNLKARNNSGWLGS